MRVLLINGSPKKEGNTYIALKEVAGALRACPIIYVNAEAAIHWHICPCSSVVYIKYTPSSLEQICSMDGRLSVNIYYGTGS